MKMALATAPPIADDRTMTLRRHMLTALLSSIIALVPGWAGRARAETAPVAKPPPCATAAHQQFDFWLGQWEVRDPAGKVVGHNRIETAHGGCALIEHWTSVTGVTGTSVNIYDRDRRQWHQTWVDSGGGLLQLDGGRSDAAMVLAGDAFDADAPGHTARQRVTWTPQPDGRVRQLWESSSDGGRTWTVVFDGLYARQG
jgi:hypothetical protein